MDLGKHQFWVSHHDVVVEANNRATVNHCIEAAACTSVRNPVRLKGFAYSLCAAYTRVFATGSIAQYYNSNSRTSGAVYRILEYLLYQSLKCGLCEI